MPKLQNAPLQEVIFEVRWALEVDEDTNKQVDAGFDLASGELKAAVKKQFPVVKRKVPVEIPSQLLHYHTVFQYWSNENVYPLFQLGPGIFTVNETEKGYNWDKTYYPLIGKALDQLFGAYDAELPLEFASLLYIDSVEVKDLGFDGDWKEFVEKNLNFSFTNHFDTKGKLDNLQFNQTFKLDDGSQLMISISNGRTKKTNEPLLIWQTAIQKKQSFTRDSVLKWVEEAHITTSDLFKKMIQPELYESFK